MRLGVNVCTIGGGSGQSQLLLGLSRYPLNISAIVTTADDGGSSGRLRDEFGILPPGDMLKCLAALSGGERGEIIRRTFNYRYPHESSLAGHTLGNLLITTLISQSIDMAEAVRKAGILFDIKGQVFPVSLHKAKLCAEYEDGKVVKGEAQIPKRNGGSKIKRIFFQPDIYIYEGAEKAIEDADVIVLSPGDLYTSLLPNLLVKGVSEAIQASGAKIIYVLNLMTRRGETKGFKASDFVKEVLKYLGIRRLDCVIYNSQSVSASLLERYAKEGKYPVEIDKQRLGKCAEKIISADVHDNFLLRHNSDALAAIIVEEAKKAGRS